MVPGGAHIAAWPTLLIVDNDAEMLQTLVCYFEKRGFHVAAGATLAEAKVFLQRRSTWTLIISDYHLPDGTGLELLCWVREQLRTAAPVLLMSGSMHGAALCAGVDYLAKPFALAALETRVHALLDRATN